MTPRQIRQEAAADALVILPTVTFLGYELGQNMEDNGPSAVDMQLTQHIPTATSSSGIERPAHSTDLSTAAEVGFGAIPLVVATAAIAIRTMVRLRRA